MAYSSTKFPIIGGGGGGTLDSANNGLSVLGGTTVQLGQAIGALGDPGKLLFPTEIPFNGIGGNYLNFVERANGDYIQFGTYFPEIALKTNTSDWSAREPLITFLNNNNDFIITGANNGGLDQVNINFSAGNNGVGFNFLTTGNLILGNQLSVSVSDLGWLFQVYGGEILRDGASTADIILDPSTPAIRLNTGTSDWSVQTPVITFANNTSEFDIQAGNVSFLGGDYVSILFGNSTSTNINLLGSGNIAISNPLNPPTSDLGILLSVWGGLRINNTAASTESFVIIPTADINGNIVITTAGNNGLWQIQSTYNGSNGGQFIGSFELIQNANYTNGSEKQTLLSTNYNINWSTAPGNFTNFTEVALNEFQVQHNIAGDGSSQLSVNTSASTYNANLWSYMGFNGEGATNNLEIISSSTIYDRPSAYGAFVNRMDFNNNPNVNVSSSGSLGIAAFYSDFCIGFGGSLDVMNDFLAGGMSDLTSNSGAFVLGTRYGFRALDLTSNVSVTVGYPFVQEGPNDLNWFAGKLNIGNSTLPASITALLQLAAGTAAAGTAPIKLTPGTNLASPEDGTFEYDGTHLYFTIGVTRHTII